MAWSEIVLLGYSRPQLRLCLLCPNNTISEQAMAYFSQIVSLPQEGCAISYRNTGRDENLAISSKRHFEKIFAIKFPCG